MVQKCCCCGAKIGSRSELSLHGFPLHDPQKLQQWLESAKLTKDKVKSHSKICSDHFEKKWFVGGGYKRLLMEKAVPTLFNTSDLTTCVYCNANRSDKKKRSFHKFPVARPNILEKWIASTPVFQSYVHSDKSIYLCSDHFERTCFKKRGDLKQSALPSIFDKLCSEESCAEECDVPKAKRCKLLDERFQEKKGNKDGSINVQASSIEHSDINKQADVIEQNHTTTQADDLEPTICSPSNTQKNEAGSLQPIVCQVLNEHNYVSTLTATKGILLRTKLQLTQKRLQNKVYKQKINRMRFKIASLKDIVGELKRKMLVSETALVSLSSIADNDVSELLKRFFKNSRKKTVSREEHPPALRSFALTLHFYSPKAYSFVRRKFCKALPEPSTLRSWYSSINGEPGFTSESFETLKSKVLEAKSKNKSVLVSFMLDEMGIKKGLQRSSNGVIRGYVDIGTAYDTSADDIPEAKDALVFMVVGLDEWWKLSIAHFLISGIESGTLVELIKESLRRLHDIGVKVVSVTMDGPAQHIFVLKQLGVSFQVGDLRPYFLHPSNGQQVYAVMDACHMLKLTRNCLGDLRVLVNAEGDFIEWKYIESLVVLQENEGLRAGNRIKRAHINYQKMKMKVSLAAQTLSSSVADSIECCNKQLGLREFKGSEATVRFLRYIDRLFDFLNSRNPFGKGFKAALRPLNETFWRRKIQEELQYLANIRDKNGILMTESKRKTPFIGFISAVSAVISIYDEYVKPANSQIRYLLTYKLSQDHLELFFCAIRKCGGWCPNPTSTLFISAYKRMLVRHQIRASNGNAEEQHRTAILNVPSTVSKSRKDFYDPSVYEAAANIRVAKKYGIDPEIESNDVEHAFLEEFLQFHSIIPPELSRFSEACIAYIAGWVVKKLSDRTKPRIKCETCCLAMIDRCDSPNLEILALVTSKDRGGLVYPSSSVIKICAFTEQLFRHALKRCDDKIPHEKNFCAILSSKVLCELLQPPCLLFESLNEHIFDDAIDEPNHVYILTKAICTTYLRLRMFAETQIISDRKIGAKLRHNMNRKIIWEHQ